MAKTVTINWSKSAQTFYEGDELIHLNVLCLNITPLHDLLHAVMHLLDLVDLRDGFSPQNETKVVLLEDTLRLFLDPKVSSLSLDLHRKVELVASNLIYLTSDNHFEITDELLDIVREVRRHIDKFLPYLELIQDFITREEHLKNSEFSLEISAADLQPKDSLQKPNQETEELAVVTVYKQEEFLPILDQLKCVIDQIISFIENYFENKRQMVLPIVFI